MYLFVLALCGMFVLGKYFLMYGITEIFLISAIWIINKRKNTEHTPTLWKTIGGLFLCRICSTIIWGIIFSAANILMTPKRENGWEILDYWFPPDMHTFYFPVWHLIIVLAICLVFTSVAFQIYMFKKRKWLYYMVISVTTLIMFCLLSSAGLPLYWH